MHKIIGGTDEKTNIGYSCMVECGNTHADISRKLENGTEIYGIYGIDEFEKPATLWFDIDLNFLFGEQGYNEKCCLYCKYCSRADGFEGSCNCKNIEITDVFAENDCANILIEHI